MSSPQDLAGPAAAPAPLTSVLTAVRDPERAEWDCAWVALRPAFADGKLATLWQRQATAFGGEARFAGHKYVVGRQEALARRLLKKYRKALSQAEPFCLFSQVEYGNRRTKKPKPRDRRPASSAPSLLFRCQGDDATEHELPVRIGLAEASLCLETGMVPLRWLYDPRFVQFLHVLAWATPLALGLLPTMARGGGGFAVSAKTYLQGSLVADELADRFNHPELACWTMDWPRSDSRSFRATRPRRAAFARILAQYWDGAFHPRAAAPLLVENAFLDRGFAPTCEPPEGLMSKETGGAGPLGTLEEAFQTNFAFGRAARQLAHNIHPGGWQGAPPPGSRHPSPANIDHGEAALTHLRIVGELYDGGGAAGGDRRPIPDFAAPLQQSLLDLRAAWDHRAHYGRTSAQDYVEAVLLEVHRARYLQHHPCVQPKASLLQDQLLAEAEDTIVRHGGSDRLDRLRSQARGHNLQVSRGRIHSDFIEPEVLFWEAWHCLSPGEQAAIAREVVRQFCEWVQEAATCDPRAPDLSRSDPPYDPLAWHRHRIHPILWQRIEQDMVVHASANKDPVLRELRRFREREALYLARRPTFDLAGRPGPWEARRE
jgi:hypothetical protein